MTTLPDFEKPMLAKLGREPFDDPDWIFEIKWDGIRALTFVEGGRHRLHTRSGQEVTERYPELAFLAELPGGLLLDGELVVLRDDRPSFSDVLVREQARGERKIREVAATHPAGYVVFDLLYAEGQSVMDRPLSERRELLQAVAVGIDPRLVVSDGVVGAGRHLFEATRARGLEGIVAKRLAGAYHPGRRTDEWIKVKTTQELQCAILGWVSERGDLKSLIVGTLIEGQLTCVGRVGSGLSDAQRAELTALLAERPRDEPLVPCPFDGHWVEPGLYCTVSFLELTQDGMLRAPVFRDLIRT